MSRHYFQILPKFRPKSSKFLQFHQINIVKFHQNSLNKYRGNSSKLIKISPIIKIHHNAPNFVKDSSNFIKISSNLAKFRPISSNFAKYHQNSSKIVKFHQISSKLLCLQRLIHYNLARLDRIRTCMVRKKKKNNRVMRCVLENLTLLAYLVLRSLSA